MTRHRRRAIERRFAELSARDEARLTPDQLLDDMIELEALERELNSMMLRALERRRHLSPFERRLFQYLTKATHR